MTPSELLADITSTVSYLRIDRRSDADASLDWISCAELVTDEVRLLDIVRSTAAGRGTDRDDIALSLFVQAYAFRVASAAIGAWLLSDGDHVLDVRPANTSIALGRHRPNALALNHVKFRDDPLESLVFDQHLSLLVETGHRVFNADGAARVGASMLWGNVAAGCASAFGAFHGAADDADGRAVVRSRANAFFAATPDEVQAAGRFVQFAGEQPEPGWFWERNSCCLWYQIEPDDPAKQPFMCEDCSLWTPADRQARYEAATAVAVPSTAAGDGSSEDGETSA